MRAILSYWDAPGRNPVSDIYGGPDAGDGPCPCLGLGCAALAGLSQRCGALVRWRQLAPWSLDQRTDRSPHRWPMWWRSLCEAAEVIDYDVDRLHGLVRGHLSGETESARAAASGTDAGLRISGRGAGGRLVFLPLPSVPEAVIEADLTALGGCGGPGGITPRSVRPRPRSRGGCGLSYTAAETAYEDRVAEAVFPAERVRRGHGERPAAGADRGPRGRRVAERWLAEARVAREPAALWPCRPRAAPGRGAMVALRDGSTGASTVSRIGARRAIEAVRVEPSVAEPSEAVEELAPASNFVAPVPVGAVFLSTCRFCPATRWRMRRTPWPVTATPWPGTVAVYSGAGGRTGSRSKPVDGTPRGDRNAADAAGRRGARACGIAAGRCGVGLAAGQLSGAEMEAVLNGANLAAIGSGDDGEWEVIQFAGATLVGAATWEHHDASAGSAGAATDHARGLARGQPVRGSRWCAGAGRTGRSRPLAWPGTTGSGPPAAVSGTRAMSRRSSRSRVSACAPMPPPTPAGAGNGRRSGPVVGATHAP